MGLREIRFFQRISQWELSKQTGIHQSRISLLERGLIKPNGQERKKLSEVLDKPVSDLFPPDNQAGEQT